MFNKPILSEKDRRYLKTINELEKIISSQGYKTTLDKWEVQNQKALDKYQLVFSWLNKQDWYKNNQHKVTKYVNTIL